MKKLLILIILLSLPSMAQANSYQINDVRVDIESEKATQARDEAMIKARRNAFNVLMQRLNVDIGSEANDRTIATLVDSFEINREKTSNNRYLASVNVKFNERAVQSYLAQNTNMAIADDYYQGDINTPQTSGDFDNRQDRNPMMAARPAAEYRMQVNINNLRDWTLIQRNLESIGDVQINRLNTRMVDIVLVYQGEATTLQSRLNRKGLQIYSNQMPSDIPYILMRNG